MSRRLDYSEKTTYLRLREAAVEGMYMYMYTSPSPSTSSIAYAGRIDDRYDRPSSGALVLIIQIQT